MAIKGTSKNIAINARGQKNIDPIENWLPNHIDLRNGLLSDAGNFVKRSGYTDKWDLAVDTSPVLLIPKGNGYAVGSDGIVYVLGDTITTYTTKLTGEYDNNPYGYHPTYSENAGLIVLCDGKRPIKIQDGEAAAMSVGVPFARFVDIIGAHTVYAGYVTDDGLTTEVTLSASGNAENVTTLDSTFFNVRQDGGDLLAMKVLRDKMYFFKSNNTEVWSLLSGLPIVTRNDALSIDIGIKAPYSLVKAQEALWWFGSDGDFHVTSGGATQDISFPYRSELDSLNYPERVYGMEFRKESVIRWFAPIEGKCFTYDYRHQNWTEDNCWDNGCFSRLPIASYMELGNRQYIGDYEPSGKIYEWGKDFKDDNGKEIRVYRRFSLAPFESGNNSLFARILFRLKRGVATTAETDPRVLWRYRIDRRDWSTQQTIDMGNEGETSPVVPVHALGVGREIEFEVAETDSVDFILTNMNLTAQELGA